MLSSLLWCANKWECEYSGEDLAVKMDKMYEIWDNTDRTPHLSLVLNLNYKMLQEEV